MQTDSFSPRHFSPVPSPPPPSPSSPSANRTGPRLQPHPPRRAVFDIVSSSPQSFTGQEKTTLQERLERSRKVRIAVKPGVPARLLSEQEVESTDSSIGIEPKEEESRTDDSPWITDSDPPTRTSTPVTRTLRRQSKLIDGASKGDTATKPDQATQKTEPIRRGGSVRVEGFDVPDSSQPSSRPTPSDSLPSLCRSTNSSTSSLSLLLARPPLAARFPHAPSPSSQQPHVTDDDLVQPTSAKPAGRTWNGEIVAATLASQNRIATPSTSPSLSRGFFSRPPSPPLSSKANPSAIQSTIPSLSTSASLPSLARSTSTRRTRFLTPSVSLTSTPESSPPRPSNVLQFTRRPTCTRQNSMGEGFSKMVRPQTERTRAGSLLSVSQESVGSDRDDTEVEEESECEEMDFNRFQPSIFASHYSNSATSLSSASSSIMRAGTSNSSLSSSPKSTKSGFSFSVPNASVARTPLHSPGPSRKTSSDPMRVDLRDLRRQQTERRQASEEAEAEMTTTGRPDPVEESKPPLRRRVSNSTTSPVSPTSMPHLQVPWKKIFSLG